MPGEAMIEPDWSLMMAKLDKCLEQVSRMTDPRRNECDVKIDTTSPEWSRGTTLFYGVIAWRDLRGCRIETALETSPAAALQALAEHMGWRYKLDSGSIEVTYQ